MVEHTTLNKISCGRGFEPLFGRFFFVFFFTVFTSFAADGGECDGEGGAQSHFFVRLKAQGFVWQRVVERDGN